MYLRAFVVPSSNTVNILTSDAEILSGVISSQPITAPYQRPVYSQLFFTLLTYAMSTVYNQIYTQLLDEFVMKPFNLTNTGVSPRNTSRAAIPPPPIDNSWGSNYGDNAPGGGLYSSLNDLSIIIQAILNETALRTPTEVKAWLKPHASTSSPYTLVGRPWEIFRATNVTPAHPHTIDIYAKNRGAYGYTAQMAVIEEYGVGLVVLTAGPAQPYRILYDAMLSVFLPAVEDETLLQAKKYAGNFTSRDGLVKLATSMDDGPGVIIDALMRNGSDILGALSKVYAQVLPQFGELSTDFRIFPTGFKQVGTLNRNGTSVAVVKEDWRINLDFLPNTKESSGSDLPGQGAMKDYCGGWQGADWFCYGNEAVDRIVIIKDATTGDIIAADVPFLRVELTLQAV